VRSLFFPAYFLSQIEFYRDCYERTHKEQTDEIPDLIPEDISSSKELTWAYDTLLLAIALAILSQDTHGNYQFNGQLLGKEREKIASALATEFTYQELYGRLKESIDEFADDLIYQQLEEAEKSITNFTNYERKRLTHLIAKYNPLN